jgi:hypothetical protein
MPLDDRPGPSRIPEIRIGWKTRPGRAGRTERRRASSFAELLISSVDSADRLTIADMLSMLRVTSSPARADSMAAF